MSKLIILVFGNLAFSFSVSFAEEKVDNPYSGSGSTFTGTPYNFTAIAGTELVEKCLKSLCPSGYGGPGKQIAESAKQPLDSPQEKNIREQIRKSYLRELRLRIESTQSVVNFLSGNKSLDNPQAKIIFNLFETLGHGKDIVLNDDGSLNSSETRLRIPSFSDVELKQTVGIFNRINQIDKNHIGNLLSEPYDFYIQKNSPEQIQKDVLAATELTKTRAENFQKKYSVPAVMISNSLTPEKLEKFKKGIYDRADLENIRNELNIIQRISGVLESPEIEKFLAEKKIDLQDLKSTSFSKMQDQLKELKKNEERLKNPAEFDGDLESIYSSCNNNLRLAKQFSPTQAQLSDFKKNLEKDKLEFQNALKAKMSEHSSKILADAMKKWSVALPPTYEEYADHLQKNLESTNFAFDVDSTNLRELEKQQPQVNFAMLFSIEKSEGSHNYGKQTRKACDKAQFNPVSDASYTGQNKFKVGAYSVCNHGFGSGTCKHEFGHALQHLFKNGQMSSQSKAWYRIESQ